MQASEIARSLQLDYIRSQGGTCLAAFAETLERAPDTTIEVFLRTRPPEDRSQLPELIAIDLRHQCQRERPHTIESYFERFPELKADREKALDLIYAEYCERKLHENGVDSGEYYQRFPEYRESLERLFRIDSLFSGVAAPVDQVRGPILKLPDVGDDFLDFRLVAELGRGAFGRVFLAEQTNLSNRRVVVKITPLRTIEHHTLARLDHPNIVPVHSVHRDELSGLQAVCMPYQSAVALSDIQGTWRTLPQPPKVAAVFLQAAQQLVPAELRKTEEATNSARFPARESYVYACSWIMHKLASALDHAHLRGIYHRDLKPSNVLLTPSGQPLLVDFNLAFNRQETDGDSRAFFGGTLPYMPPEQIQVLHPAEQGRADDVGPRSDIYSLAATIFELLAGRHPFDAPEPGAERLMVLRAQLELRYRAVPSARALNPLVPADLDAVLAKCLDPAAHHRYETAAQLTEDLARYLADRPLRHIGKIPARQVLLKFVRRNRKALMMGTVIAVAAISMAVTVQLIQRAADQKLAIAQQEADLQRQGREDAEAHVDEASTSAEHLVERESQELLAKLRMEGKTRREDVSYEFVRKGQENYARRKLQAAILWFNKAESLGYEWYMLHYNRGRCLVRFDRDMEALGDFDKAIALKPDYGYGYLARAFLYATSKECMNIPKAVEDLKHAERLRPLDEDEGAKVYLFDLARAYSAIYKEYGENSLPTLSKEEALLKAESLLFKAVQLGLPPRSIMELNSADRFNMLEPLLSRHNVTEFLKQHEGVEPIRREPPSH